MRRFKVPLVRPPRAPGSAPPTRAAPEPISLPLARRTPPQRHDRMARAHGACGARALRHGWVLDFNDFIARVRDKVAAAECQRAFLKCELAQIGRCARAPAAPVRSARVGRGVARNPGEHASCPRPRGMWRGGGRRLTLQRDLCSMLCKCHFRAHLPPQLALQSGCGAAQ